MNAVREAARPLRGDELPATPPPAGAGKVERRPLAGGIRPVPDPGRAALGPTAGMLSHLTLASMAVFSVAVVATTAAADIGVSPAAIGIYVSAVYGFGVVSGLFTGSLVSRYGPLRTCQSAMLLAAMAMVLLALAHPLAAAASAMLLGLAYGMLNPASARILSSVADRKLRPLIFSVKQSGVPLGGVLAGLAIPVLAVGFGWKAAILAVGFAAIAVAVGCQPLRRRFDAGRQPGAALCVKNLVEPLRLVWRAPDLKILSIISVAYAGAQICLGSFFVVYFITQTRLTLIDAGIAFTALQLGGFAGRLAWGAIAERLWPAWNVLILLGGLMALNLLVLIHLGAAWPQWLHAVTGFALGATCYGWNGVFFSEIARRAPDDRCEDATGAVQSIMFAGVVVFPPLFAALVALTGGFTAAYAALAVMVAAAALLGWKYRSVPGALSSTGLSAVSR